MVHALKKCYFETYRFSEDLDFTLNDPSHIDDKFLHMAFHEITEWIYEHAGIELPKQRIEFEIYKNPRGVLSCQGKLFYRGPTTATSPRQMPRIKLDLSVDEILVDSSVSNRVSHKYSDILESGIYANCYSYIEIFAEKIRALGERTRPRDLFDVINLYRRPESKNTAVEILRILNKKCDFKLIKIPTLDTLMSHKDVCAAGWEDQLSHQLPALPPFDAFWNELPIFFDWLYSDNRNDVISIESIPIQSGAVRVNDSINVDNYDITAQQFGLLDKIRFAASNHLCIELNYRKPEGVQKTSLIEPYSLGKSSEDNLLLLSLKHMTKEVGSFRIDRILDVTVTDKIFTPSYQLDLIPQAVNSNALQRIHLPK